MKQPTIVQVLGPTGAGKSHVAMEIARKFNGEIVSADAFQVYKGFDIGTDKAVLEMRREIPHHLIDIISDNSQFHAWLFLQESYRVCEEIHQRGSLPIVCGGTALYLRVQIRGIFPEVKDDGSMRRLLKGELSNHSPIELWNELHKADPEYADKIGPNDPLRIVRGLEIFWLNGIPPTQIFKRNVTPFSGYRFIRIGLNPGRADLYRRINVRVERMIEKGLVEEVKKLLQVYSPDSPPFRGLGYKEILQYLSGIYSLSEAIEQIKRNTRRFAKRQLSWFRKENDIVWFHPDDLSSLIGHLESQLWKKR